MKLVCLFTFYVAFIAAIDAKSGDECKPSITQVSGKLAPRGAVCAGELVFEDNFDTLDTGIWQHEQTLGGGGNWEFQWYTNNRSVSYAEDGVLHIQPRLLADITGEEFLYSGTLDINGGSPADECTNPSWYGCERSGSADNIINPIQSARLRTLYSFNFLYGKVEVRAKAPAGDWLWPAIWMLPEENQYAGWPASGEIDIMESRGNRDLVSPTGQNLGTKLACSTMHWGPDYNNNKYMLTHFEKENTAGFDGDFHNYQLEWTPEGLTFSIDDELLGTVTPPEGGFWQLGELDKTGVQNPWRGATKMAPFDQKFYLVLNLAVGGTAYFTDEATNAGGKPWKNDSPRAVTDFWEGRSQWLPTWNVETSDSHFQVDYVKVWAV